MEAQVKTSWLSEELTGITLPDKRFRANIISIAEHLDEHVGVSFSAACGERLRKCAWRLFSTEELSLLSIHQQRTFARCADEKTILVAEDTTDIHYRQLHKQGMGELGGKKDRSAKGLNMHTALAMNTSGHPLGIVHQKIWAPKADKAGTTRRNFPIEDKETIKWINTLKAVNEHGASSLFQQEVVLIGDREADFFEHYAQPRHDNVKLLIRVQQKNRRLWYNDAEMKLADVLLQLQPLGEGTVTVWRRKGQAQRTAAVTYCSATVILPPPYKQKLPARKMQLVYVKETSSSTDAVEWILLTDLPADTLTDAIAICHYYSFRWKIERFHYVLKSGLLIEQLQIISFEGLVNVLQLYSLIAWHLLWLQYLARTQGNEEVTLYIDRQTIEIIQTVSRQRSCLVF